MLVLFGSDGSGSAAVELALLRCGLPYRVLRASSWEADSAQAELQRANPLGQIPALQMEDGSVLTESAAILTHLGLTHPASHLLPDDAAARAQVLRGLVFIAANCYAAIGVIDYPDRWCLPGADTATLDSIRQGTRARLNRHWELFADVFGGGAPYLAGREPGALDFLAAVVSRWSGTRDHLAKSRPTLLATLERVEAHPVASPVFARHWPR
ncbi:MAG TPA: glutathione S-transferase family protein [Rubrivivax sp.]|nr:glutathione S-transferase family protein [Rubrivivax sp.]